MPLRDNVTIQREMREALGFEPSFIDLFEKLDQTSFFLKNARFQHVYANDCFRRRLPIQGEAQYFGKNDFDFFPAPLAEKFRKDDESVLTTGVPLLRMVELFPNHQGIPEWYETDKLPVHSASGRNVGVMGTVIRYEQAFEDVSDEVINQVIKRIRKDCVSLQVVTDLVEGTGLSHRQFNRRFKEVTGITPQQFLLRTKIEDASAQLRSTDVSISDLALEHGFCDQSAFTARFRSVMGYTPLQYRKNFKD